MTDQRGAKVDFAAGSDGTTVSPASQVLYPTAFITKLWDIVNEPRISDIVRWNKNGTSIVISDVKRFESSVLPTYFQHNKMISFVRQLNAYGFHKVTDSTEGTEFFHTIFRKDGHDNIRNIQRKKSDRRKSKGSEINPNEVDESGYATPQEGGDVYPQTIPTSSLQAYELSYKDSVQTSFPDEIVSPMANQHQKHQIPISMSITSSPIDPRFVKKGVTTFPCEQYDQYQSVNQNNHNTDRSELIQIQLLNAILLEVQELKNNVEVIHAEVRKIHDQNQETQNYMISILQQMFAPLRGSGNQGPLSLGPRDYYNQGSANSTGSLHSLSTKTYIPTPSAESSKVKPMNQGVNAHLSQFVAFSQMPSPQNAIQPVKSFDDIMASPPTSELLGDEA